MAAKKKHTEGITPPQKNPFTNKPYPDANYYFYPNRSKPRPKYSEKLRDWAEQNLGVRLPETYINLLRQQNGGSLRLDGVQHVRRRKKTKRFEFENVSQINQLPGLSRTDKRSLPLLHNLSHREWGLDPLLIPLEGDGHWWKCLDYRKCGSDGEPCLTYYDVELSDDDYPKDLYDYEIAPSIDHFLLNSFYYSYDELIISIDNPELTPSRLNERLLKMGCNVTGNYGDSAEAEKVEPNEWNWPMKKSMSNNFSVLIRLEPNGHWGMPAIWDRPAKHPLLYVEVDENHVQKCAEALNKEFQGEISFLIVPARYSPLKGIAVEESAGRDPSKAIPKTPLELESEDLADMVAAGMTKEVRKLLKQGADPFKSCSTRDGRNAMDEALFYFHAPTFRALTSALSATQKQTLFEMILKTSKPKALNEMLKQGHAFPKGFFAELFKKASTAQPGASIQLIEILLKHGYKPTQSELKRLIEKQPQTPLIKSLKKAGVKPPNAKGRDLFEQA